MKTLGGEILRLKEKNGGEVIVEYAGGGTAGAKDGKLLDATDDYLVLVTKRDKMVVIPMRHVLLVSER